MANDGTDAREAARTALAAKHARAAVFGTNPSKARVKKLGMTLGGEKDYTGGSYPDRGGNQEGE